MSTTVEVDWNDPCARAEALRRSYYDIVSGLEKRVRFGDREVWYSGENLIDLKKELRLAEEQCAAKSGGRPRRYAIRAGSRTI